MFDTTKHYLSLNEYPTKTQIDSFLSYVTADGSKIHKVKIIHNELSLGNRFKMKVWTKKEKMTEYANRGRCIENDRERNCYFDYCICSCCGLLTWVDEKLKERNKK